MMMKEKSNPWARVKYLYVLPLAALAVSAFARPEVSAMAGELSSAKVNDLVASVKTNQAETLPVAVRDTVDVTHVSQEVKGRLKGTPVFEVVEQMPEFPDGGTPAMLKYFEANLRYPAKAREAGTQGRVTVQFVVDRDGSIRDAEVLRPVDPLLDAEALRLVRSMPRWRPGMQKGKVVAVKYTVPVTFRLDTAKTEPTARISDGSSIPLADVLLVVDGKEMTWEEFKKMPSERIQAIDILKKKELIARYTSDASKKAVMLVTLKDE